MKKIKIYLIMIMCVYEASAQKIIDGTPGVIAAPGGFIKDIKQAELSPLNIKFVGEPKLVEQSFSYKEEGSEEEAEQDRIYGLKSMLKDNLMDKTASVMKINEVSDVSVPPLPDFNQKITSQSPAYNAAGNEQGSYDPSDAQIAAGPNHLVVLANGDARILNKQNGAIISQLTMAALFNMTGFVFDPRIMYDPYGQRFVALALYTTYDKLTGCNGNIQAYFRVLISYNSDPTQGWYWYDIDIDPNEDSWLDFAFLGFNKDWICIAGDIFCGSSNGIFVINKTQAYAGGSANYYSWPSIYGAAPAFTYDNSIDKLYLVKTGNPNLNGTGFINSWYINSVPQLIQSNSYGTNPWQAFATDSVHCPKQLGGPTITWANRKGASMLSNCVYRNGNLWCTHPIFLPASGVTTRSSAQWWAVDPATGGINQVGRVDDNTGATSTYYHSIGVNQNSDVVVTYGIYNSAYYPSAAYNYRNQADGIGLLPTGIFYAAGSAPDWDGRLGDYSQCAVDPLDATSFWVVNQISVGPWRTQYALIPGYFGCYTDANFGNYNWSGYTKNEASNSITSAEMIQSPSVVEYDAGALVVLSPGFIAQEGTAFHAYIDGCGGARLFNEKNNITLEPLLKSDNVFSLNIIIFPNPANDLINIKIENAYSKTIFKIYNSTMQLVKNLTIDNESEHIISISDLSPGIYFIDAQSDNQHWRQKFIINR